MWLPREMSFLGRIFSSWYSERLALVVQFFFQIDVHTYKRDVGERRQLRIEIGPRELPKMKITHMCERREFAVSPFSPRSRKQLAGVVQGLQNIWYRNSFISSTISTLYCTTICPFAWRRIQWSSDTDSRLRWASLVFPPIAWISATSAADTGRVRICWTGTSKSSGPGRRWIKLKSVLAISELYTTTYRRNCTCYRYHKDAESSEQVSCYLLPLARHPSPHPCLALDDR